MSHQHQGLEADGALKLTQGSSTSSWLPLPTAGNTGQSGGAVF